MKGARAQRPVMRSLFQDMPAVAAPRVPQYSARTILEHELETLDFLISRHPLSLYEQPFETQICQRRRPSQTCRKAMTTVGWWVTGKLIATKDDEPMEFISFEDTSAIYETVFFPQAYARFCHMLNRSRPYVLTGTIEEEYGVVTLTVDSVISVTGAMIPAIV